MSSSASYSTPPAYQFYINEWRSSRSVQRMTWAQRGMYREMLDEQWQKGGLPDCPRACAEIIGGTPEAGHTIEEEWIANWPVLRRKFVDRRSKPRVGELDVHDPADHDARRQIINLRLERLRRERKKFVSERKTSGRLGGLSKAKNGPQLSSSTATAKPSTALANPSSSSSTPTTPSTSTSSASVSSSSSLPEVVEKPNGRSGMVIHRGERFVVFGWMLESLQQMLGAHCDAFCLDEWFFELDAKAKRANVVLPQRESWKWIHDQTLAEAARRGLPIAASPQATGKTSGNAAAVARFVARGNS